MQGLLLYITLVIVAILTVTKFVRDATSIIEDSLNEEKKRDVRNIVKNLAYGNGLRGSSLSLKSATDTYFGEKYFSFISFKRSFYLTMTFFLPIFLIGVAKNWTNYYNFPSIALVYTVIPVFIVFLVANSAIDFASVIKSRFLLSIAEGRTIWHILSIAVLDIFITLIIFTIIFLPLRAACIYLASAEYWSTETFIDTVKNSYVDILKNNYYFETLKSWINLQTLMTFVVTEDTHIPPIPPGGGRVEINMPTVVTYMFPEGACFYSTFAPSVWMIVYAISLIICKWRNNVLLWLGSIAAASEYEERPIQSLGNVMLSSFIVLILIVGLFIA